MTLAQFRRRVVEAFGPNLEHATPSNVREFVARVREEIFPSPKEGKRWVISVGDRDEDYETIMLRYFADTLNMSADHAAISLWLYAFEMWFSELEITYSERFAQMWGPVDEAEQ